MGLIRKLKLKLAGDTADRQRLADFMVELRRVCEAEGPWAFARMLDAPEDTDPRQIAYLLVWAEGPGCAIWDLIQRYDAVDLVIDAAAEGFDAFLAVYPKA